MTDLITEARELCEKAMALEIPTERLDYSTEYVPLVDAIHIIPELCDALEKANEQNKQLLLEVCKLACESVEREKKLAKLEAEVERMAEKMQNAEIHADCMEARAIAYEAEVERLREGQRWIPVTGKLPERYQSVLAARKAYAPNNQHYVCEAWLNDFSWQNSCGTMENVTHWMLLPSAPEGEKE